MWASASASAAGGLGSDLELGALFGEKVADRTRELGRREEVLAVAGADAGAGVGAGEHRGGGGRATLLEVHTSGGPQGGGGDGRRQPRALTSSLSITGWAGCSAGKGERAAAPPPSITKLPPPDMVRVTRSNTAVESLKLMAVLQIVGPELAPRG